MQRSTLRECLSSGSSLRFFDYPSTGAWDALVISSI